MRKGMEYEFTTFFEIDAEHNAYGAKDRTSLFDRKYFIITPKVGETMMEWLDGGVTSEPVVVATQQHKAKKEDGIKSIKDEIVTLAKACGGRDNPELMALIKGYTPNGNPNSMTDETELAELKSKLIDYQAKMTLNPNYNSTLSGKVETVSVEAEQPVETN